MPAARGFFWSGRVLFLSGVVGFSSLGNAYGCTARAGFGRDFRELASESVFSCRFWGGPLKLWECVLGPFEQTEFLIGSRK